MIKFFYSTTGEYDINTLPDVSESILIDAMNNKMIVNGQDEYYFSRLSDLCSSTNQDPSIGLSQKGGYDMFSVIQLSLDVLNSSVNVLDASVIDLDSSVRELYLRDIPVFLREGQRGYVLGREWKNNAFGLYSFAEGYDTSNNGMASHTEGEYTIATGRASHAEGYKTTVTGEYSSHAEGINTIASGKFGSHAEGNHTRALGINGSHAEGCFTFANNSNKLYLTYNYGAHAEGFFNVAHGDWSHTEGGSMMDTRANIIVTRPYTAGSRTIFINRNVKKYSALILYTLNNNQYIDQTPWRINNVPDFYVIAYDCVLDTSNGDYQVTLYDEINDYEEDSGFWFPNDIDVNTKLFNLKSVAFGRASHIEGYGNIASGNNSHAEGYSTTASGENSHAEGNTTVATNEGAHAEGSGTTASGAYSHAEGYSGTASSQASHTEGFNTSASGKGAHAEGVSTQTTNEAEHASGKFNKSTSGKTRFSVGVGTSSSNRKNALEIAVDSSIYINDIGGYDGTNVDSSVVQSVQLVINTVSDYVDSLMLNVDTLVMDVNNANEKIDTVSDYVDSIVLDVDALTLNSSDLYQRVADAENSIYLTQQDIIELNEQIDTINSSVNTLNTSINDLAEDFATSEILMSEDIIELNEQIDTINSSVNTLDASVRSISVPVISTNIVNDANSDVKTASPKAVKTYVDSILGDIAAVLDAINGEVI